MKTSVSSYSFGSYMSEEKLGYLGIIDKAADMGFEGIEYTDGGHLNLPGFTDNVKARAAEKGIEIVALAIGANFLQNSSEKLKDEIKRVCGLVDIAAAMVQKCCVMTLPTGSVLT